MTIITLKKVQSSFLIQYTFCQIQGISRHGPLAVCSCGGKKNKKHGACTQPWLCKQETKTVALTIPANQYLGAYSIQSQDRGKGRGVGVLSLVSLPWLCMSMNLQGWHILREVCICLAVEFKYQSLPPESLIPPLNEYKNLLSLHIPAFSISVILSVFPCRDSSAF